MRRSISFVDLICNLGFIKGGDGDGGEGGSATPFLSVFSASAFLGEGFSLILFVVDYKKKIKPKPKSTNNKKHLHLGKPSK